MSRLLLKARPVEPQLADRLRAPRPDGFELYLDTSDIASERAIETALENLLKYRYSKDFAVLIEGPVRSLDGEFFDLGRGAEADRELIRRTGSLARRIHAKAVNIHVIAPTDSAAGLGQDARWAALERSVDLVRFFVDTIHEAGAVPTVENMPPVLRMRECGFYYSPIGLPAEDLVWLCEQVPGLRTTLDLSHAGLYVNCRRSADLEAAHEARPAEFASLFGFVRGLPAVDDVGAYARTLGSTL